MKFGIWLALAVAAWLWFGHLRRQQLRGRAPEARPHARSDAQCAASSQRTPPAPPAAIETIVACAHCGVHVPASDTVVTPAGARFCCEAHRRLHPAA